MISKPLTDLGWEKFFDCKTCPNNPQSHYSHKDHPGYVIRFAIRAKTFRILYQNQTVAGPFYEYQAADKLKSFKWL
jgi:hypothetical protein